MKLAVINLINPAVKAVSVKTKDFSVTRMVCANLVEAREMLAARDNNVLEICYAARIISAKVAVRQKALAAQDNNAAKIWFAEMIIIALNVDLRAKLAVSETITNVFSLPVITTTYAL